MTDQRRIELLNSLPIIHGSALRFRDFIHLNELLEVRRQMAIKVMEYHKDDDNALEMLDYYNDLICKFLAIPR